MTRALCERGFFCWSANESSTLRRTQQQQHKRLPPSKRQTSKQKQITKPNNNETKNDTQHAYEMNFLSNLTRSASLFAGPRLLTRTCACANACQCTLVAVACACCDIFTNACYRSLCLAVVVGGAKAPSHVSAAAARVLLAQGGVVWLVAVALCVILHSVVCAARYRHSRKRRRGNVNASGVNLCTIEKCNICDKARRTGEVCAQCIDVKLAAAAALVVDSPVSPTAAGQ